MRGNIRFVDGMPIGSQLGEDEFAVDGHLKNPAPGRNEMDVVSLPELFENILNHAHGTGGIVSGPAELNADGGHGL